MGRRVLVPHAFRPSYVCDEHGGRGWRALIVGYRRQIVTVRFLHATSPRGLPYIAILQPL